VFRRRDGPSPKAKSFDANLFLGFRLAPDQFPFARQVQIACDTAKLAASRLSGKNAPSHPTPSKPSMASRVRALETKALHPAPMLRSPSLETLVRSSAVP
jgi:hypothetical protein